MNDATRVVRKAEAASAAQAIARRIAEAYDRSGVTTTPPSDIAFLANFVLSQRDLRTKELAVITIAGVLRGEHYDERSRLTAADRRAFAMLNAAVDALETP